MRKILFYLSWLVLFSCGKPTSVDLYTNAKIYTSNDKQPEARAFAVSEGVIIGIGDEDNLRSQFNIEQTIDLEGRTVVPGFIDAHCHFLNLGFQEYQVDLVGTASFEEIVKRIIVFQEANQMDFIQGRGWDQNDWEDKTFPNKKLLDSLFPDTPIALSRIDGHAILCNQAALELGGVTSDSKIDGGTVVLENGVPTGVLVDNAESLVMRYWPKPTRQERINALQAAEKTCVALGLTTVDDAGLNRDDIELIDSLHKTGDLKIRVYAMASANADNLEYYLSRPIVKTDRLHMRSFKYYVDGALGSRGALLRAPYSDAPHSYGLPVNSLDDFKMTASRIATSNYQMNTHAIGDSANHVVLNTYKDLLKDQQDRRWRVEHAQVLSMDDFNLFENIIPSVQPTHATSDMYWAEDRLGSERMQGAYALKSLLQVNGRVALGTDFPVERVSPFLTFYAATARQDLSGYPKEKFKANEALSRQEALYGMTIWAAYANFESEEKGSLEVGKMADFVVLDQDILTVPLSQIPKTKVIQTYIAGEAQIKK